MVSEPSASSSTMLSDLEEEIITDSDDQDSSSVSSSFVKRQKTIAETFADIKSYAVGGNKNRNLTNSILFMICSDYQPLSIVENEGFQHVIKRAAPQYKMPSRKIFSNLLVSKYEAVSFLFRSKISRVSSYTLTTDIWTETMQTKSFLGVTIHFGENDKIYSATLGIYELDERHTANYISEKLEFVCKEWGVANENVTAVVTDGADNMTKAVEMSYGKKRHLHCFAHQLNLVADKSIKAVDALCIIL